MFPTSLSTTSVASLCVLAGLFAGNNLHAQQRACAIRKTPMSAGDTAMARDDYKKATELYTEESNAAGEDGDRAHDGWVRSLLEANNIAEAEKVAQAWASASPKSAWA